MNAFGGVGLAQGLNAGMQEVNRSLIQERDYNDRKASNTIKQASDAETTRQQLEEHKLKFEKQQLELEELKNTMAKKETYEGFSAYSETNDPKYLTELLKNPTIKKTLPDIVRYDNVNAVDDRNLMEPLGITPEILNKEPTRYVKATNQDGSVHIVDMFGAYAKTGYSKIARQEILDKMKGALENVTGKQAIGEAELTLKAFETGDANEVLKALQLTNPKLYLKATRGSSSKRDSLQQYMEALELAGVPKVEQPAYVEKWVQKTTEGVGAVAKEKDVKDLTGGQHNANALFTPAAATNPNWKDDAQAIQNSIMSNLSSEQKTMVVDADKKLTSNNMTATMVEKLLNSPTTAKMSRGAIDNILTAANKITGLKNAQALDNVDFNSRSGMIVAEFIKEISGTAAADAEVARLMDIFLGGNLTDETYVKRAMAAFADQLRIKNNEIGKQYKQYLPYTVGITTNLRPKSGTGTQIQPGNKASVTNPSSSYYLAPPRTGAQSNKPTKQGGKPSAADFWK